MSENYIQVIEDEWDCRVEEVDTNEVLEFFDWLQGKAEIKRMYFAENPKLSQEAALSVIYYLQERLGVLEDKYEMCRECGCIFDSEYEGTHINDDYTLVGENREEYDANYPEEMYGHYCDDCRPD